MWPVCASRSARRWSTWIRTWVGTLQDSDENWGIVQAPGGVVHRVKVGNYMGRNIGKIVNIFEDRIELREIVQDSQGRWEERQAAIALVE